MGSPDAQPEGWHTVTTPEETPDALCQNGPKITRADPPIFGGTFTRPSETGKTFHRRDGLWHPGPSVRASDGDRTGAGRADSFTQDPIPAVSSTPATRALGKTNDDALPDGRLPNPRTHAVDPGPLGHQQEVCETDGVSGESARRERRRAGQRLLDTAGHRRRTGKAHGPSPL